MKNKTLLVSIIIVNFNGKKWLEGCLASIKKQTYSKLEVIIVDNNSTDTSVTFIKKKYPEFKIVLNNDNVGFAQGNNLGVEVATGDVYFLLNNDTILCEDDLIEKTIKFVKKNPKIGVLQPKICLLNNPDKIDLCGSFWTPTTMLYHYGCFQDEHDPLFNKNFPVFTCKGAAMFIRKECVEEVGLFDPDFWCYYEETDFCHRVWSVGYECWYFSETKMLHSNGGTSLGFQNDFIQFHNFKNKLRSFIKNFSGFHRVSVLFRFTLTTVFFAVMSLVIQKPKNIKAIFSAYVWNIKKLYSDRNTKRTVIKNKIPAKVTKNPGLQYYIDLVRDLKLHTYDADI